MDPGSEAGMTKTISLGLDGEVDASVRGSSLFELQLASGKTLAFSNPAKYPRTILCEKTYGSMNLMNHLVVL
jgi:hypothetical protein